MFLSSVLFKLENLIDYDRFFSPIYSVQSENALVILNNGVKHCGFTIE